MKFVICLVPVIAFLTCLYLFDSFKLVGRMLLLFCICWGAICALTSYYLNSWLVAGFSFSREEFFYFVAPFVEEALKSLAIMWLVHKKRIGFIVDAAIYGFAVGTGFSLVENIIYLSQLGADAHIIVWILRGFGTALMHGGTTAIFAVLLIGRIQRNKASMISAMGALIIAIAIHSIFNHFFLHPVLQTLFLLLILPAVFVLVFRKNNRLIQDWLELEFSNEVGMLLMIRKGAFEKTKAGVYLVSIKRYFEPEMIVDLYCYISLYLELSIKAKRNLMLRENGLDAYYETDMLDKLLELKSLRKKIGKAGEMALWPIIRMGYRDIWKLNLLKSDLSNKP